MTILSFHLQSSSMCHFSPIVWCLLLGKWGFFQPPQTNDVLRRVFKIDEFSLRYESTQLKHDIVGKE